LRVRVVAVLVAFAAVAVCAWLAGSSAAQRQRATPPVESAPEMRPQEAPPPARPARKEQTLEAARCWSWPPERAAAGSGSALCRPLGRWSPSV
jgi:hypothetical protein